MILEELIAVLGFEVRGEQNLKRFNNELDRGRKSIGMWQAAIAGAAGGAVVGLIQQLTTAVANFATAIPRGAVQIGATFENLEIRLTSLMGSAKDAERAMKWIREFAIQTPLELQGVVEAFTSLKAYGLDPMAGSLQAITDQASQMGGSQLVLERTIRAVGQMWGKQKISTQEMNQLIEVGVPAWDMLSEATGKNVSELMDLVQSGKLGRDVIQSLIDTMGRRSLGASERMSRAWTGIMSNIADEWNDFLLMVAESGFFEFMKEGAQDILNTFRALKADGTLEALAKTISVSLVNGLYILKRTMEGTWRVGKMFFGLLSDAYDQLGTMGAIGAGAGTIAALGGKGMLIWLAKRFPILLIFLFLEDLATYLEGGKSVLGAAIDWLKGVGGEGGELEATTAAIAAFDQAWRNLFAVFGENRDQTLIQYLASFVGQLINLRNVLQGLKNLAGVMENVAKFIHGGEIPPNMRKALDAITPERGPGDIGPSPGGGGGGNVPGWRRGLTPDLQRGGGDLSGGEGSETLTGAGGPISARDADKWSRLPDELMDVLRAIADVVRYMRPGERASGGGGGGVVGGGFGGGGGTGRPSFMPSGGGPEAAAARRGAGGGVGPSTGFTPPTSGPLASPGTYRPQKEITDADLDQEVVNTIAGEVSTKNQAGVDAVINNMTNRIGAQGAWYGGKNLKEVARQKGQYEGYRKASKEETEFIRGRIRAVLSGSVPDNTGGANEFRADWYRGPWQRKHFARGTNIAGNVYAKTGPIGPYAAYDEPKVEGVAGKQGKALGGGAEAIAKSVNTSYANRYGGDTNITAPITINNPKGEVVPDKVSQRIDSLRSKSQSSNRATDIASNRPVPDGPAIS